MPVAGSVGGTRMWPVEVNGDGLARVLDGLVIAIALFFIRNLAIVLYAALSRQRLAFPTERRLFRRRAAPRRCGGRRVVSRRRTNLGVVLAAAALLGIVAMVGVSLVVVAGAVLFASAVGYWLGPLVAAVLWAGVYAGTVVIPLRRAPDRGAALGRLYRSARQGIGADVPVPFSTPLHLLVRWSDGRVRERVDLSIGLPPWADGARRGAVRPE